MEGAPLKLITDLGHQSDDWRVNFICASEVKDFCIEVWGL